MRKNVEKYLEDMKEEPEVVQLRPVALRADVMRYLESEQRCSATRCEPRFAAPYGIHPKSLAPQEKMFNPSPPRLTCCSPTASSRCERR